MKSKLPEDSKIETISTRMRKQHYYLKFLKKELRIFTYIEDEGFYYYNSEYDSAEPIEVQTVIDMLVNQHVDFDIAPDRLFNPLNYLVSHINKIKRLMSDEYFLTPDQAKKKGNIRVHRGGIFMSI